MGFDYQLIDKKIESVQQRRKAVLELLKALGEDVSVIEQQKAVPSNIFSCAAKKLKDLKVAAVMDRFTLDSFAPECNLLEVTPEGWKKEISEFQPDMLFIESAWEGKDGLWHRKIANGSKEYFEMTSYCQEKNIPIVFWNKEDPVWTDVFMPAARMADAVFTTELDCIKKYKTELGHDRVYHLHFAAQPVLHNPIEKFERKDKFCFAGAYYHRYKQRAEVFDKFSEIFIQTKGFDIFDRNYQSALPEHAFPEHYNPYILGKLDPSEIDVAYKGYSYGVNMNSVNQSQTMFARRVFEMMASNTVTVGNYARGTKNYFGDLTICTDDEVTLKKYLDKYCADEKTMRNYRLQGLRKVLSGHLYEDRLDYIVNKVFGISLKRQLPLVTVVSYAKTKEEAANVHTAFVKQTYANKKLILVTDQVVNGKNIICISEKDAKEKKLSELVSEGWLACFNAKDYYGKSYLLDMVLALRYTDADAIGKTAHYEGQKGTIRYVAAKTYVTCDKLNTNSAIIKLESVNKDTAAGFLERTDYTEGALFAVDEFNYCKGYMGESCPDVDDILVEDCGIPEDVIEEVSLKIKRDNLLKDGKEIKPSELAGILSARKKNFLEVKTEGSNCVITSLLEENQHQYIYFGELYSVKEYVKDGNLAIDFPMTGDLDIIGVCVFYDAQKKKISPAFTKGNHKLLEKVPESAVYFELGIRPKGKGTARSLGIRIGSMVENSVFDNFITRGKVLVLTNQYPSHDNLYRNMFVHKRVLLYKENGILCDVMRMNVYAQSGYREFEGVNILEGHAKELHNLLASGTIKTVCVHFMDRTMWEVLKEFAKEIKIIVWFHGVDVQPWWRRECVYQTEEELNKAKVQTEEKMAFWKDVFARKKELGLRFVFVSEYFANMVEEDYQEKFTENEKYIIPNCIDTELFSYEEKPVEQRKKIVSIRPYASPIYGNDIAVKAIQELAKRKEFSDMEFCLIGDGELFETLTKPLRKYKNVTLRREFLRQDEIAKLYKEYGVVLIPTRGDTQGVSRDEAMSSGVVPVTNAVAAILEFADDNCAVLAPAEDYRAMADGILKLYGKPEFFKTLSKAAAKRVRSQSSYEHTIAKELELMK